MCGAPRDNCFSGLRCLHVFYATSYGIRLHMCCIQTPECSVCPMPLIKLPIRSAALEREITATAQSERLKQRGQKKKNKYMIHWTKPSYCLLLNVIVGIISINILKETNWNDRMILLYPANTLDTHINHSRRQAMLVYLWSSLSSVRRWVCMNKGCTIDPWSMTLNLGAKGFLALVITVLLFFITVNTEKDNTWQLIDLDFG